MISAKNLKLKRFLKDFYKKSKRKPLPQGFSQKFSIFSNFSEFSAQKPA